MKKRFTLLTAVFALLAILALPTGMKGQTRADKTDVIDYAATSSFLGNTATSSWASDFTITGTSGAEYYIHSMGTTTTNNALQWNKNGYLYMTVTPSGYKLKSVTITTTADKNIGVYAQNSAYSAAPSGNALATLAATSSGATYEFTQAYSYLALKGTTSSTSITDITIVWEEASGPATYSVTYNANGGSGEMIDENSPYEADQTVTLLENTFTAPEGMMWSAWQVKDASNNTINVTNSQFTMPASDVTVTALWTADPNAPQYEWVLTDLADLTSSDIFVIVGTVSNDSYSMANDGTSNPVASSVTIQNNKISSIVTDNIKWNISGNATNGYSFYPNGNSEAWLYCNTTAASSSNSNLRVGTGDRKLFVPEGNTLKTKDNYTARYWNVYTTGSDWRGYVSNSTSTTVTFYKRQLVSTDPTIYAANVSLGYNETEGEIEFEIENPVSGANITATTTADWLTIGTVGEKVPFTCSTNTVEEARTATVTLNYVKNGETLTSKEVTITQAAHPTTYNAIPALYAAATGTVSETFVIFGNWVVSGISHNGYNVFVTDGTNGFVINGDSHGFEAGNTLTSTTPIACNLQLKNGFAQITGITASTEGLTVGTGGTVTVANIEMSNLAGVNTGALVSYENLTCSVSTSGNYTNYDLTDGTTTIRAYGSIFSDYANYLEAGKTYNITGVYQQYNNTKEILPRSAADIEEVVSTEPSITVSPTEIDVIAEGGTGTISVTAENLNGSYEIGVQFYVDPQTQASDPSIYQDWLEVLSVGGSSDDFRYTVSTNSGSTRSAYLTICAFAENGTTIAESQVIAINQAAYTPAPTDNDYVRISSLDQLTNGSIMVIAARYDENATNYYAMKNTISNGKAQGAAFVSTTSNGNEILPASIVDDEDDYYWTVSVTNNVYTFTNSNGDVISYNSSTNFNMNGTQSGWTIATDDAGSTTMVPGYSGFVVKNESQTGRGIALNDSHNFGPYAVSNMTGNEASKYNFFLDFFVQTESVEPTTTLEITGYTNANGKDGYYLIASPYYVDPTMVVDKNNPTVTEDNMTEGNFDLYYFDQSAIDGKEWRNWKANDQQFNLEPCKGYLYAKEATQTATMFQFDLSQYGTPYDGNGTINLTYVEGVDMAGYNLVGNPYTHEVTFTTNDNENGGATELNFLTMNEDGDGFITASGTSITVQPLQGFFAVATGGAQQLVVSNNAKKVSNLNVEVRSNGGSLIDNAVINFGNANRMEKYYLSDNTTRIYIPQDNHEMAVVRSASEGEMPVSFKAAENGTYTLSFEAENTEMRYMHLIDNMTGADVDLLATPSYSFEANTTDYANRFRIVFKANNSVEDMSEEHFAFFNGSEWVVSNEGEATLQVIDMMGRVLSSQTINGNANIKVNEAKGVYVIQLTSGNSTKTQKVVVK